MNFYENFLRKQTSKQTNIFSPCLHAKSLSLMTMTLTLKMTLMNYCLTSLNEMKLLKVKAGWKLMNNWMTNLKKKIVKVKLKKYVRKKSGDYWKILAWKANFPLVGKKKGQNMAFTPVIYFTPKKNTVHTYTIQPSLKYFSTFTMVNKLYVNKLFVNKQ